MIHEFHRVEKCDFRPLHMELGVLYLQMYDDKTLTGLPWSACFSCPCGCGADLSTFFGEGRPAWTFTEHEDGTVTIRASVLHLGDCRSHFFITRNKIDWC